MRGSTAKGERIWPSVVVAAVLLLTTPHASASRTAPARPDLLTARVLQPITATKTLAPVYASRGFELHATADPHPATFALFDDLAPASERLDPEKLASGVASWELTPNLQRIQIFVTDSRWCRESLGPIDSPNLYQAFGLDPMNKTDPLGLAVSLAQRGVLVISNELEGTKSIIRLGRQEALDNVKRTKLLLTQMGGLSELDAAVMINRLRRISQPTVAIDPGHGDTPRGKFDCGASSEPECKGEIEKDWVLTLSAELARSLERQHGVHAVLTRTGDITDPARSRPPLVWRVRYARSQGASAFVSVHMNANKGLPGSGMELLYREGDEQDRALAQSILAEQRSMNLRPRPLVPRDKLAVLNAAGPTLPATIVEVGFINNPADRERIAQHRAAILAEIARGVRTYLDQSVGSTP